MGLFTFIKGLFAKATELETQVDSLSMEQADEFMNGPLFAANPIGIDVDFEALNARRKSGENASSLTDYATAGK